MTITDLLIESEYIKVPVLYSSNSYGKMIDWCFKHCEGNFYSQAFVTTVDFYFNNEQDAVHFSLIWYNR